MIHPIHQSKNEHYEKITVPIVSNFQLRLEKKKIFIGQEIENQLVDSGNSLTLDTVSGDIYLN